MSCKLSRIQTKEWLIKQNLIDEKGNLKTSIHKIEWLLKRHANFKYKSLPEYFNHQAFVYETKSGKIGYSRGMFETIDRMNKNPNNFSEKYLEWKKQIDFNKENNFEPDYFEYFEEFEGDENILPSYEETIQHIKYLISLLDKRLSDIKQLKHKYAADEKVLKELIKKEQEIELRLNGDSDNNITGLKDELALLKNKPPLDKFNFYIEENLKRLDYLSNSENPEELKEANSIMNYFIKLGTFNPKEEHPLFNNKDIFDENGQLLLQQSTIDYFSDLKNKVVNRYQNKLISKEMNKIVDTVNTSNQVNKTYGDKRFTKNELFSPDGLKDISWMDMFLMDTTNNIFSVDSIIPQVMSSLLQESFEEFLVIAKKYELKINELQPDVEKILKSLGYGFATPFGKGVSYSIFQAKDKNGLTKDAIVQRFTPDYFNERNKIKREFSNLIDEARKISDPDQKKAKIMEAYNKRNNWLRKNTIVFDIRKLDEIKNDSEFSEFNEDFVDDNGKHKQELINLLGQQGYEEELAKQKQKLKQYKTARKVFLESILANENVNSFDELSYHGKWKYRIWLKNNDPFKTVESYYKGEYLNTKSPRQSFKYNYSVPKKNEAKLKFIDGHYTIEETNKDLNYFDENFKIIESHKELKEFHTLLVDIQKTMMNVLPPDVRNKFNAFSLPTLKKNLTEILFDPNTSLLSKFSEIYKYIVDSLKELFRMNIMDENSYEEVDPITGKKINKVSTEFLKSNKKEINDRFAIELIRLKKALNRKQNMSVKFNEEFNLINDVTINRQEVINLLAENLGVENNLQAIKNALPNTDLTKINLSKVLKDIVTSQVVNEKSFDLPKILKLYSFLTMEYAARQKVLPLLEMMKNHYNEIKNPKLNNINKSLKDARTGKTRLEGLRENSIRRMESWFERAVLGNYNSKNEFGDTTIKRKIKLGLQLTPEEEKESWKSKLSTVITGRILNTDEKIYSKKLQNIAKMLDDEIHDAEIELAESQDDFAFKVEIQENLNSLQKTKERVLKIENKLGGQFSITSVFDALFNFIRYKGLGWNLSASITNFAEGQVANTMLAASGDYFTPENIFKANQIVSGSFLKNLSFGKVATKGAILNRILMDRYRVLQDASNELQKASAKSAFSSLKNLSPYELTRRTEYLNQSPLMIAILLDEKIKGKDKEGNIIESSVWEAMNPMDGTLKEEFRTEENINNWEKANGKQYNNFKIKLEKAIINAHGDYHDLHGNMASEYITGKAIMMFKRWMARQFYLRFAVEQPDIESNMQDFKGRYRSHTVATSTVQGGIIGLGSLGLLGAGPVGLAVGAGLGYLTGKLYGVQSNLTFLQELSIVGKELFLGVLRVPINSIAGKSVIKYQNLSKLKEEIVDGVKTKPGISKRDITNMKSNMTEMSIMLFWTAMLMFTKALAWDDDDDEQDSTKRQLHNLLANRFIQLSSQANMYLDPTAMFDNTVGSIATLKFFDDVSKTITLIQNALEGHDMILTGLNAGESKLYRQVEKTFFPSIIKSGLGFENQMQRQFVKTPMDRWFWGSEKISKLNIREEKLKTKLQYKLDELPEKKRKEIEKQINSWYRKGRKESYEEAYERIKKQKFVLHSNKSKKKTKRKYHKKKR